MLLDMAEKIRLVLLVDEEIQAALRLEANKRTAARKDRKKVTMGEVLEELVRAGIPDTLHEVRLSRAEPQGGSDLVPPSNETVERPSKGRRKKDGGE